MEYKPLNKQFEASFRSNWDRAALSNYEGETYTYSELAGRIAKLHLCFEHCGLNKGDKVAICARNQVNWGVSFLAAMTYGAVPVPILHEFKPESIQNLVNHSDAKMLFVGDTIWSNLDMSSMPELSMVLLVGNMQCVFARTAGISASYEALQDEFDAKYPGGFKPEDVSYCEDKPGDLALINYTSGTSGFSKGVMIPYRALLCNVAFAGTTAEPQMDCTSNMVAMLPSAHMYGMMFEFLFEMTIGAHVHFLNRAPSPKIIMKAFAEVHPDTIIAVPLIIEKVYKSQVKPIIERRKTFMSIPLLNRIAFKKIRNGLIEAFGGKFGEVILGGAAFNPEVESFFKKIRFPYTCGYGMTECAPLITYCKWNRTKKGACGTAITGCQIRIDSKNPQKIPGEIQVKGDNVFLGYYKMPKETAEVLGSDGWFRTGDVGTLDKDGYLALKGRSKSMILTPNGQNIYPEEIESSINNLPYVTESLVVVDKNVLVALIYPDNALKDENGLSDEQLEQTLNEEVCRLNGELPNYCRIAKVELFPEEFEKTPKKSIKRYLYQR